MEAMTRGQVNRSAADVYEEFFVPALFRDWAAPVCEAAGLKPEKVELVVQALVAERETRSTGG